MKRGAKIVILAIYLLLAIGFSVVNPLFESPDEHWHYFTAQYIAENGRFGDWIGQEAAQPPLATRDNQPRNGRYPTSVWGAGRVIEESYTLTIPADLANGRYALWLGMYNAADPAFACLPLSIDGTRQPNDTYLITTIEVKL